MTSDIVILDGARTAIGTFGGSLAGTPPIALAATAARAALERVGRRGRRRSGTWSSATSSTPSRATCT